MSEAYKLELPAFGITLEADRLRSERHELIGELTVRCLLPGTRTVNGCLSVGDFNFSSVRARSERAKLLSQRADLKELDWVSTLEDLCHKVIAAERIGQPAIDLRDIPRPERDEIQVDGFAFPRRHGTILFGDGGSAKSYTALYLAGRLAKRGLIIGLFDWELSGEDHRERLECLFGDDMPLIKYCRCERPLTIEADRLRRIVREEKIDYAIFDSIAFACDGPPEAAEIAGRYFRAVREIGIGSLHIAHVTKAENNDQRPFGSAFWHNGARSTWYVQAVEPETGSLRLGFWNRKANLGPLKQPLSYTLTFTENSTIFSRADVADSPELAGKLSVRQRMFHLLRRGARTAENLATEIEADVETVRRTIRRYKNDFVVFDGGLIGIKEKSA